MVDEAGRDFYWFQSKAICRGSLLRLRTIDHPFRDLQDLLQLSLAKKMEQAYILKASDVAELAFFGKKMAENLA